MASYGGYSKTTYGAQGNDDGGGFMGGSQQGSQGGGGGSKFADDALRPTTIKQLIDCKEAYPGAELQIDGINISQITIIGQVRSIHPQATNITYKIDDGTASIDVKYWVDSEKPGDAEPKFAPEAYVRAFGRLTLFNGRKHFGAHLIRAIDDFNEVNYHMLEATYVHLFLTKGPPTQQGEAGGAGGGDAAGGGDGDGLFVNDGYGAAKGGAGFSNPKLAPCGRNAQALYKYLQNTPGGDSGLHINIIANGAGLSISDASNATNELLNQGLVYTTIDDETWAILEY